MTDGCKCDECPEELKDICITKGDPEGKCGDGNLDVWEECDNWENNGKDWKCTEECTIDWGEDWGKEDPWNIENDCNSCPCEYADFGADLTKWDTVRAKLWDKSLFVFYRYSNSAAVESFIDID